MTPIDPSAFDTAAKLRANLGRVLVGRPDSVELALVPLLAKGHLLVEDVPGVGKTTLAKAIARSIAGRFRRVQFTSDLLPMDLVGGSVYNQKTSDLEFRPGPVFTDVLLADEINRASPRTQSALLECMEEGQVSIDGETRTLGPVFFVVATQNPIEHSGTFELPEAQLDRFLLRLELGYPSFDDELEIFERQREAHPIDALGAVTTLEEVARLRAAVASVHVEQSVRRYACQIVRATREHPDLVLGASPRGTLGLLRAAQAHSILAGRAFVTPDSIKRLAVPVLGHRVHVAPQSAVRGLRGPEVVAAVRDAIDPPVLARA